jgi:hypothetical protein
MNGNEMRFVVETDDPEKTLMGVLFLFSSIPF